MKILLVDDGVEFATTLAERLEIRGYSVTTAFDGEQALLRVEEKSFDAILLDVVMPGLDGFKVLQQIHGRYPDIPVILLTGYGSTRDGMEGMHLGAYDYLMKPVDIDELMSTLETAVRR